MKIFLLGLPGSGKTTLGRALAAALGCAFVDLDAAIESAEGQSIPQLFASKGEAYFRQVESSMLEKWCHTSDSYVMATGGGTPCFHDNMGAMKLAGLTIFLDVPIARIAERLRATALGDRPLFKDVAPADIESHLELLRSKRISYYHLAHSIVTDDRTGAAGILELVKRGYQP